jgi:hypothetical protein
MARPIRPTYKDGRFYTEYSADWTPPYYQDTALQGNKEKPLILPRYALKKEGCGPCQDRQPGYQPQRPDKGYKLLVNDLPYHDIAYTSQGWTPYVVNPIKNE